MAASQPHPPIWPLHEAKDHLSRVIDQACTSEAQVITRHGRPMAVVVAIDAWERLLAPRRGLVDLLRDPRVVGKLDIPPRPVASERPLASLEG